MIKVYNVEGNQRKAFVNCLYNYLGKGKDTLGKPYGVLDNGLDDPLGLSIDRDTLTISIKPGVLYCYGRQVVVDELTTALTITSEIWDSSNIGYFTIYLRINLTNVTNQYVTIEHKEQENTYVTYASDVYMDDLESSENGIYDVPIGRFKYNPLSTLTYYLIYDYEKTIDVLPNMSRQLAKNIPSTSRIGNSLVTNVFTESDNSYKAKNTQCAQYSRTAQAMSGVTIPNNLQGMYTRKRVRLCGLSELFSSSLGDKSIKISNGGYDNLYAINFSIIPTSTTTITGHYAWTGITIAGYEYGNTYNVPFTSVAHGLALIKGSAEELAFYLYETFPRDNTSQSYPTYGYLELSRYKPTPLMTDIRYIDQGVNTKYHVFALITVNSSGVTMTAYGDYVKQPAVGDNGYQYLSPTIAGSGDVYVDFIYKGDVRL